MLNLDMVFTPFLLWMGLAQPALGASTSTILDVSSRIRDLHSPTASGAMAPRLVEDGNALIMSWLEPIKAEQGELKGEPYELKWARLSGANWSKPRMVARSLRMFANTADMPSVIPVGNKTLFAHWLEKVNDKTYAYDAVVMRSGDGGDTWRRIDTLRGKDPDRREENYDGFVSFLREEGGLRAFWVDGRLEADNEDRKELRTARIGDRVETNDVLDGLICSCCDTSAVRTAQGPLVVYRGRTKDEIRDILAVRRKSGAWTAPRRVHSDNWQIAGCPVNGAQAAASGDLVAVAWFTGAMGKNAVKMAFSRDAGGTFEPPIALDDVSPAGPVGRVDVVVAGQEAFVSWLGEPDASGKAGLYVRRVTPSGMVSAIARVATMDGGWHSGFPQMLLQGKDLMFAWTAIETSQSDGEISVVRSAALPIQEVPVADIPSGRRSPQTRVAGENSMTTSFLDLGGKKTGLSDMKGKVILVNLWATWCEPCHREQSELIELHQRYAAKGLSIVAISLDRKKQRGTVDAFVKEKKLPYPVWLDWAGKSQALFSVTGVPATFLLMPDGKVIFRHFGFLKMLGAELEETVRGALGVAE